jgi:acetyl esterase/lipase
MPKVPRVPKIEGNGFSKEHPLMKAFLHLVFLWFALLIGTVSAQERPPLPEPPQPPAGVKAYRDLAYVPSGHERQKLDLYVPEAGKGPFPLIVWIHGGAWKRGSKERCPPLPWSGKGYVVASINYRLCQDAKFPAQIKDCKTAIRWLRAHARRFKVDPDRIVAWGGSAGGHLASLLGTAGDEEEWELGCDPGSSQVQAVIDWYGRADLSPVTKDPAWADSPSASLLGGWGEEVAQVAREASPIYHVSKDDPPFLIMHGDMDKVVPVRQSQRFAKALKDAGVKVKLLILTGVGHGGSDFLGPEQVEVIDAFLNEYLARERTGKSLRPASPLPSGGQ